MSESLLSSYTLFGIEHQHVLEQVDSCNDQYCTESIMRKWRTLGFGILEFIAQGYAFALRQ